jgi:hypothetical protein
MFNGYLNNKEITITVNDKYIKRSGEQDIYLVVDENKNTYKITDLFFKFKFDSTDLYNKLENIYFIDAMVTPIERYTESEDRNAFLYTQIGVTDYNDLLQIGYPLLYIVQNVNEVKTIQDIKIG